jgi:hypothetical protein
MPALVNSNLLVSNDRLESRMRENRQSGSEGGEPQTNAAFLPLSSAGVEGPGCRCKVKSERPGGPIHRIYYATHGHSLEVVSAFRA